MAFRDQLNSRATVKKLARTRDNYGSWTEAWVVRYQGVACRIQPLSGREQALYNMEQIVATDKMFCEGKFKRISEQDQVIVGGVTYDVELVRNIDLMGHHLEIELRRLKKKL